MSRISNHSYQYVLQQKELSKMIKRGETKCRKCGEKLEIGDEVISRNRYHGARKKYHAKCFLAMYQ